MSLEEIIRLLNTLGVAYSVLESGTDGAALVLPEYGRVLGLWPYWRGENALWVNPEFFRCLQAGSKQEEWLNPGGDRMWICPESEFFMEDAGRPADTYKVPRALDPGTYARAPDKSAYCMVNRGDAWAFHSGERIGFRIQRRIRVYPEKELAALWGTTYLRQAGYDEEAVLEVVDCPLAVGLWNVLPVPTGGMARIPLQGRWTDAALAGLPAQGAVVDEGSAVVECGAGSTARIWLGPADVKRRAAYIVEQRDTGRSALLVKEFDKNPSARYASEAGDPASPLAVGVSCAGPHAAHCELGFRSPAAGRPAGARRIVWKSSLWAFSGRNEEIAALARRLTA